MSGRARRGRGLRGASASAQRALEEDDDDLVCPDRRVEEGRRRAGRRIVGGEGRRASSARDRLNEHRRVLVEHRRVLVCHGLDLRRELQKRGLHALRGLLRLPLLLRPRLLRPLLGLLVGSVLVVVEVGLVVEVVTMMLVSLSVLPAWMGGGLLAGLYAASPSTACVPAVSVSARSARGRVGARSVARAVLGALGRGGLCVLALLRMDGRGSAGRTVCGLPLDRLRARGLCVRSIGEGTGWRAVCSARRARSSGARRSVRPRVAPNEPCRLRQKASSH